MDYYSFTGMEGWKAEAITNIHSTVAVYVQATTHQEHNKIQISCLGHKTKWSQSTTASKPAQQLGQAAVAPMLERSFYIFHNYIRRTIQLASNSNKE